ncbi:HPr(Ser) kinase/phosphatase, partial [Akkermansiaceae bacterium]|nr:HPr(Ser) kinase/phosphatase [Akkermansiaceae bacterium]
MPAGGKRINPSNITVQEFLERYGKELELTVEHPVVGLDRKIQEPAVNRPGLALSGFFTYFAKKRIQVFGNSEISYLKKIGQVLQVERFSQLCAQDIPCLVVARSHKLPTQLLKIAHDLNIAVITSPKLT